MDTNAFANSGTMAPQSTPDYLKPTKNGGVGGAVSNMVKAIMDGNNKFKAQQAAMANNPPKAGGAAPEQPPGEPLSLAPPSAGLTGAAPMSGTPTDLSQSQTMSPFEQGASPVPFAQGPAPGVLAANGATSGVPGLPNGADPTVNALFSPIPGGQFGG